MNEEKNWTKGLVDENGWKIDKEAQEKLKLICPDIYNEVEQLVKENEVKKMAVKCRDVDVTERTPVNNSCLFGGKLPKAKGGCDLEKAKQFLKCPHDAKEEEERAKREAKTKSCLFSTVLPRAEGDCDLSEAKQMLKCPLDAKKEDDEAEEADNNASAKLIDAYYSVGKVLIKSFNGIVDKDVFLEIMTDENADECPMWKNQPEILYEARRAMARELAVRVCAELTNNEVLEWRNLLLSRKGYSRIARMFSEFLGQRVSENLFGTPLNIGCSYPKVWDKF